MNLTRLLTVMRKELKDGFRDRRAIYTVLFSTLFGPLLIGYMLNQMAGQERAAQEIRIPIVGRQFAPILVQWLGQQSGVEITLGPSDPEGALRERKVDMVLVIDKEFAEKFREAKSAPVQVFSDSTRQSTRSTLKRLNLLLARFNAEMGSLRLIARGISPEVASALKIEQIEVSTGQQRAAMIFNIIPLLLILAAFTAAMQIATDSTAGERERGSLEPLLLNAVPRWQLVGGKWLAAAITALVGLVATLFITSRVLARLPLEDLGIHYHLGTQEVLLLIAAIGPIALVSPAIQIYISCFARSFKEAQSYISFLVMGAALPGVISTFHPMNNMPWTQPIPILGQYALGNEILSGKVPSPFMLIAAALASFVVASVFLWLATRLFSDEKIIFGR